MAKKKIKGGLIFGLIVTAIALTAIGLIAGFFFSPSFRETVVNSADKVAPVASEAAAEATKLIIG